MPQQRLRAGFALFFVLCGLFGVNLCAFQSQHTAMAAKRIVFPGTAVAQATPSDTADKSRELSASDPALQAAVSDSPPPVVTGSVNEPDLTRAVQRELQVLGYEAGGVDGVAGLTTRAAIMAFEWDTGQPLTAEPSQHTLQALLLGNGRAGTAGAASAVPPGPLATQVIRTVQQGLTALGYHEAKISGQLTPETQRAIRLFEVHEGLVETGRISGTLASRVVRLSGDKRLADIR